METKYYLQYLSTKLTSYFLQNNTIHISYTQAIIFKHINLIN